MAKKIHRKKLLISFVFTLLLLTGFAFAASDCQGPFCIPNPITSKTFEDVILNITKWATMIAAPLATLMVLVAAYLYMFSGGDTKKLDTARKALTWALVGFAIVLIAQSVAALIKNVLGIKGG